MQQKECHGDNGALWCPGLINHLHLRGDSEAELPETRRREVEAASGKGGCSERICASPLSQDSWSGRPFRQAAAFN